MSLPEAGRAAVGPARSRPVVGAGLLGTSLGLALRQQGVEVELSDPSPTALALATDLGAGRAASPSVRSGIALVVVAAPPDVVADVVAAELAAAPTATVTDLASVKAGPLKALQDKGIDLSRYVGSHPMAGRERSGGVAARADLFAGRPWVVCPHPASVVRWRLTGASGGPFYLRILRAAPGRWWAPARAVPRFRSAAARIRSRPIYRSNGTI